MFIMSNLNNTNTKLPAKGHQHKRAKNSPRLQTKIWAKRSGCQSSNRQSTRPN